MNNSYFKKVITCIGAGVLATVGSMHAQLTENFDDITLLTGAGWSMQNLSSPIGTQANWFQGNSTVYASFNGAATSYIAANYNFVAGASTISGWLMTPQMVIRNGDVFTFYSRKVSPDTYPDGLEVRMSTNGASTNAGTSATSVGDFTTLLLTINPTLVTGVYPIVWTQYTVTISGLTAPQSGRIAFRYFVTNGGPSGANSDYIGIDAFQYTPYSCPAFAMTPASFPNGTAGVSYIQSLSTTGPLGIPTYAVTAGALPTGLTLSASGTISGTPTATGTFNFTVTVADASGCSGSTAYSITIDCPVNGATLSSFPALCDNGPLYTLIEGSPAGGTYSGTGVSGGAFDPASGSQSITYTLIDAYGCTQMTSSTITVNTAPVVTLSTFTAVCDNGGTVALSGESPAGGTFSGTNVSGGMFDPSGGAQNITYTYTDGNGCTNSATENFPVNAAPTVTLASLADVCDNSGMVTLGGESPSGGTFSGTGVSGNTFDPASGTQTITYTYTDGNGCTNNAAQLQTVHTAPVVTLSISMDTLCQEDATFTLSGESPAGGTWSGPGVTGNTFDPMAAGAGVIPVTYIYTDSNSCAGSAVDSILVDLCLGVAVLNGSDFTMYPNPANNTVTLTLDNFTGTAVVRIISVDGKVVLEQNATAPIVSFGVEQLAKGIYMVGVQTATGTSFQKLIVE